MTREEHILNKAIDYSEIEENFLEYDDCGDVCNDKYFIEKAFIEGAEYADKTILDHACDWLKENIDLYSYNAFNTKSGYTEITLTDEFETAFRQAIKGEL